MTSTAPTPVTVHSQFVDRRITGASPSLSRLPCRCSPPRRGSYSTVCFFQSISIIDGWHTETTRRHGGPVYRGQKDGRGRWAGGGAPPVRAGASFDWTDPSSMCFLITFSTNRRTVGLSVWAFRTAFFHQEELVARKGQSLFLEWPKYLKQHC